jgi:hypothetical protein
VGPHSIGERKINDDEVSKSMHYEPASRAAAAQKHVNDCKGEDAEQHLDEDVEDFSFEGWFEEEFQTKGDAHPACTENGHSCTYICWRRVLLCHTASNILRRLPFRLFRWRLGIRVG